MQILPNYAKQHATVDVGPVMSALGGEIESLQVDPSNLSVSLDWVQYRRSFRPPIEGRRYLRADGVSTGDAELAIDVRRIPEVALATEIRGVLSSLYSAEQENDGRLRLEEFCRPSQSIIWAFNRVFWQHLSTWESVFQRGFVSALPGGVSDGMNPAFWTDRLSAFVDTLDGLRERGELPEEIYVLEMGVGSGHQAKIWLDTFRQLCAEGGRDYYDRVRYLMADFSHDVLRAARETTAEHGARVSSLNLDITDPQGMLTFLHSKVLFAHTCNLYDNLPTDELVRRGDSFYDVSVRAYLPVSALNAIRETYGIESDQLGTTIQRLLRIGPDYFDDVECGVHFWADVWNSLCLEERSVELDSIDSVAIAPELASFRLGSTLADVAGDVRVHLSTAALQSFVNTLPLLHPHGVLQVQDLFVTDLDEYQGTFRGPGKMDGAIVNWLSGPLFCAVGEHLGYDVRVEPFAYRERSNTGVLIAKRGGVS